jgi:hypothetical protein
VGAVAFLVVVVAAAIGWMYLLRGAGLLPWGPAVPAALPLQQLAGSDAQPLLRVAAAWIPAGAVAALVLRRAGVGKVSRLVLTGVLVTALLIVAGAVSDAAAVSGSVTSHVTGQFSREGTWAATGLMMLGALLVRAGPPAARRASSAR